MSEFSTNEIVKGLSKAAHLEESKGHFEPAENLYKAIVTLEEMAHFPAEKIKQAKLDLLQCEMTGANEAMKKVTGAYPSKYDLTIPHPSQSNDNGIFRSHRPIDSNDNGLFRDKQVTEDFLEAPEPEQFKQPSSRVEVMLDTSSSMPTNDGALAREREELFQTKPVGTVHGRPHFSLPAAGAADPKDVMEKLDREKLRQTKPVEETKPIRHINIIESPTDYLDYPSKGCP